MKIKFKPKTWITSLFYTEYILYTQKENRNINTQEKIGFRKALKERQDSSEDCLLTSIWFGKKNRKVRRATTKQNRSIRLDCNLSEGLVTYHYEVRVSFIVTLRIELKGCQMNVSILKVFWISTVLLVLFPASFDILILFLPLALLLINLGNCLKFLFKRGEITKET